jgi:hypothetical protein
LQSTTNLVSPALWTTVSPGPVVIDGQNAVTNPISGTQQFFRLSQRSEGSAYENVDNNSSRTNSDLPSTHAINNDKYGGEAPEVTARDLSSLS